MGVVAYIACTGLSTHLPPLSYSSALLHLSFLTYRRIFGFCSAICTDLDVSYSAF